MQQFWLGTHEPSWLARTDVGLFVSHRRLSRRPVKKLPRAIGPWALDSGGFSELSMYGRWVTERADYIAAVRRYAAEIGNLAWAAPQDWMCEDDMLAKTGLTIAEHQARTTESVMVLRQEAPDVAWIPVLQGQTGDDYLRHADQYARVGFDLSAEPVVGVGTVCRRKSGPELAAIMTSVNTLDINVHGFGLKFGALRDHAQVLHSADSMAWSYGARRNPPLPDCTHPRCNNCIVYALKWRERLLAVAA